MRATVRGGREREGWQGRGNQESFGRSTAANGGGQRQARDTTRYFFSNFPERWGAKELWPVFQRYDRVWDVFVSTRRDRTGKRFGFVSFVGVKNPTKLEHELNTIMIGNTKMNVNFPRFDNRSSEKKREGGHVHRPMVRGISKPGTQVASSKKTYAQVVSPVLNQGRMAGHAMSGEDGIEQWQGPYPQELPVWLTRSLVGVLKNIDVVPSLQNCSMLKGFSHIQVRYLGGDKVLLTGPEGFDLAEALQGPDCGVEDVFVSINPWTPQLPQESRLTWVKCYGFPVHMWARDCLVEAVKPTGDLVSIDHRTSEFLNLEFARV